MATLVLLRHGQSQWNLENRFTGWVDVPLSPKGRAEAEQAGKAIASFRFARAYTSTLIRAHETLLIACAAAGKQIPIFSHATGREKEWAHFTSLAESELDVILHPALNERYYGDLQGLNKDDARERWGEEQVHTWRRSYDEPPPQGESLKDTYHRTVPFFTKRILPELLADKDILIVAHGNSLRAIIKHLEEISDDDIPGFELPTGIPRCYTISPEGTFTLSTA